MIKHLFVYGTLKKKFDHPTARALRAQATFVAEGSLQARLYLVAGYPGAVRQAGTDEWVRGEIYELPTGSRMLTLLDEYEEVSSHAPADSEFVREVAPIRLPDHRWLSCWVFFYNRPVAGLQLITEF